MMPKNTDPDPHSGYAKLIENYGSDYMEVTRNLDGLYPRWTDVRDGFNNRAIPHVRFDIPVGEGVGLGSAKEPFMLTIGLAAADGGVVRDEFLYSPHANLHRTYPEVSRLLISQISANKRVWINMGGRETDYYDKQSAEGPYFEIDGEVIEREQWVPGFTIVAEELTNAKLASKEKLAYIKELARSPYFGMRFALLTAVMAGIQENAIAEAFGSDLDKKEFGTNRPILPRDKVALKYLVETLSYQGRPTRDAQKIVEATNLILNPTGSDLWNDDQRLEQEQLNRMARKFYGVNEETVLSDEDIREYQQEFALQVEQAQFQAQQRRKRNFGFHQVFKPVFPRVVLVRAQHVIYENLRSWAPDLQGPALTQFTQQFNNAATSRVVTGYFVPAYSENRFVKGRKNTDQTSDILAATPVSIPDQLKL